jgi:hypothetical protein
MEKPQLVATSRHITGHISIKKLSWEEERKMMTGISEIIEGDPYSLFIHVPEGWRFSKHESDVDYLFHRIRDGVLEIKFSGDLVFEGQETFTWSVFFTSES